MTLRPPAPAALALAAGLGLSALPASAAEPADTAEPNVQHIVTEDDGVRVEELRVRGETKRIVVRSKLGKAAEYEVLPADGGRDLSAGPLAGTRGSAGRRVWNVLSF